MSADDAPRHALASSLGLLAADGTVKMPAVWAEFVGPCAHGRDPWTRCDVCEEVAYSVATTWLAAHIPAPATAVVDSLACAVAKAIAEAAASDGGAR